MSKIIVPRTIHVFVSLVLCTVSIVSLANTDSTMAGSLGIGAEPGLSLRLRVEVFLKKLD
jgi:hypothetical protein